MLLPLKTPLRVFYSFIFWGGAKSAESGECFFYKERGECDPRDDRGGCYQMAIGEDDQPPPRFFLGGGGEKII